MKICVVGNSHAAALKSALAVADNAAGARIDFFVMPGGAGPHLLAEGGRLFPAPARKDKVFSTIPGAIVDGLDLEKFDAVMISAAGLPSHRNGDPGHILNRLALASHIQDGATDLQGVSEAVMKDAIKHALEASPGFQAISLIRSAFSGRFLIQLSPLPTRAVAAYKVAGEMGSNLASQYGDRLGSFLSWYSRRQIELISARAEQLDAHVLAPDPGFVEDGFTPNKFRTPDPWHMNTAYGRLVLRGVYRACGVNQIGEVQARS